MKPDQLWYAEIGPSILGPIVLAVRRAGGKRLPPGEAPAQVREYLNLPADRAARQVIGGLTWEEVKAAIREHGGVGRLPFRVPNPAYRQPRPKLTVREHGPLIRDFRGLLDYFGAETPRSLNRRIYKDTDCGASISIYLAGEDHDTAGIHCGSDRWETLTGDEQIDGFTIQTIVEGSDATVDSDLFRLPCPQAEVQGWIADMEAEADRLWHEANDGDDGDESE